MSGTIVLLNLTVWIWLVLGAMVLLGYARQTLYSELILRYYLVSTVVVVVLAMLLRYVRMEG